MPQPVFVSAPAAPTKPKQRPPGRWAVRVVRRWQRQRARERAFRRAYREFRATHAHLHELCFDRRFLSGRGAEALACRDAQALARSWTTQFRYRDETRRAQDVRLLTPPAESFIALLDAQLERAGLL